jgi:hypothetical protein
MKVRIGWEERFKLNKKIIVSQSWLGILNTFRTIYYQNIIELIPQIKLIKEDFAIAS